MKKELTYTKNEIELLDDVVVSWHEDYPDYTDFSTGHTSSKPIAQKTKGVLSSLVKTRLVTKCEQEEGCGIYYKFYPTSKGVALYLSQHDYKYQKEYIGRMNKSGLVEAEDEETIRFIAEVKNILFQQFLCKQNYK